MLSWFMFKPTKWESYKAFQLDNKIDSYWLLKLMVHLIATGLLNG
jgi:hypothetical protein